MAPNYTKPMYVRTDAPKYGLAAIFYQIDVKRYIRMASRSLGPMEIHYGAPQRELRAVLEALRWFKVYLYGRQLKLYTDHQSLVYLLTRDKVSSVIENWMYEILSFNFEIRHLPGLENHLPDALSRFYYNDTRKEDRPDYVAIMGALTVAETDETTAVEVKQNLWTENTLVIPSVTGIQSDSTTEGTIYTQALGPENMVVVEDKEFHKWYIRRLRLL